MRARLPRCGGGARAVGISGDPPGDNGNHPKASRTEQTLPKGLWGLLGTMKKIPRKTGGVWAVWVGASWDGAPVFDH